MAVKLESIRLPQLPSDWPSETTFKPLGKLSPATQRNIEPVGVHFLSEARRKRHKRTFSEDERYQAEQRVKKSEGDDDADISDNEDPLMVQRDAKDWKVSLDLTLIRHQSNRNEAKVYVSPCS